MHVQLWLLQVLLMFIKKTHVWTREGKSCQRLAWLSYFTQFVLVFYPVDCSVPPTTATLNDLTSHSWQSGYVIVRFQAFQCCHTGLEIPVKCRQFIDVAHFNVFKIWKNEGFLSWYTYKGPTYLCLTCIFTELAWLDLFSGLKASVDCAWGLIRQKWKHLCGCLITFLISFRPFVIYLIVLLFLVFI